MDHKSIFKSDNSLMFTICVLNNIFQVVYSPLQPMGNQGKIPRDAHKVEGSGSGPHYWIVDVVSVASLPLNKRL